MRLSNGSGHLEWGGPFVPLASARETEVLPVCDGIGDNSSSPPISVLSDYDPECTGQLAATPFSNGIRLDLTPKDRSWWDRRPHRILGVRAKSIEAV